MRSVRVRLGPGGPQTRALIRAGRGPTLLCLHGYADTCESFRAVFAAMNHVPGQLVALDLPGFGEGPPLAPRPARVLPQLKAFVQAAMRHYGDDGRALLLLGHSLGGRIVLEAAAASRTPPADGVPGGVVALAPAPLRLRPLLRLLASEQRFLPQALQRLRHLPDAFLRRRYDAGYRRLFFAPGAADPSVFAQRLEGCDAARVAADAAGLHRIAVELDDPVDFSLLTMPVDLVWGCHDRLVPAAAARRYEAAIPHAQSCELPYCGHEITREAPEQIAALLAARLSALAAATPSQAIRPKS